MASAIVDRDGQWDERTIRAAIEGDEAAFERIYEANRRGVYRVARAITGDHELARDVVQETFLSVHRSLGRWRGEASLATWIVRIAVRQAITHRRRASQQAVARRPLPEPAHDPRAMMDERLALARVQSLASQLAGQQGLILRLRLLAGMTNRDIAAALGLTESNVRMQMSKAVRRLRELV